jgi:hypothetical protein
MAGFAGLFLQEDNDLALETQGSSPVAEREGDPLGGLGGSLRDLALCNSSRASEEVGGRVSEEWEHCSVYNTICG